jgi:hypothetical protein
MQVVTTQDSRYVTPVKTFLTSGEHVPYLQRLLDDVFVDRRVLFWGGAVRDPILSAVYGKSCSTNDFDLLIDDSEEAVDFPRLLGGLGDIFYTRFGSPKWRPDNGFEIDMVPFSNTGKSHLVGDPALEAALQSCEFTTSAIAFDPRKEIIYSCGAFEGYNANEIELLRPDLEETHILVTRLALMSMRFGFNPGPKASELISTQYQSTLDRRILRYLRYKDKENQAPKVIEWLNNFQSQTTQ